MHRMQGGRSTSPLHAVSIQVLTLSPMAQAVLEQVRNGTYQVDLPALADTLMDSVGGGEDRESGSIGDSEKSSER